MANPELELPSLQPAFFNPKNLTNPALQERRRLFFEAMRCKTPEVLRDLRDTVLPIYQEGYLREFRRGREEPESDQEALVSLNRFRVPVVRAIVNWTIRYRLVNSEDNWTVTHAGLCVQTWAEYRRGRDSLLAPALVDTSAARYARGPTFDFSMPGWDFEFQLWTEVGIYLTQVF